VSTTPTRVKRRGEVRVASKRKVPLPPQLKRVHLNAAAARNNGTLGTSSYGMLGWASHGVAARMNSNANLRNRAASIR
jgi:hypothetical protein